MKAIPAAVWDTTQEWTLETSDSEAEQLAREHSEEDEDEDEVKDTTTPAEGDEDEEEEERSDRGTHRCTRIAREWVVIHDIMFQFQGTYQFVRQLNEYSRRCYVVDDAEHGSCVLKLCDKTFSDNKPDGRAPKEVRTLSAVQSCAYVIPLLRWHDLGEDHFALVMPRRREDDFPILFGRPDSQRNYMFQLLTALQECHERNVFVRDIKPSNVLWDDLHQRLVLIDFDAATFHPFRRRTDKLGTRDFKAPELEAGTGYDWRADIYSAGVCFGMMLHEIDEGDIARDMVKSWGPPKKRGGRRRRRKSQAAAAAAAAAVEIEPSARALLQRMVADDPARRPSFAECLEFDYFQKKEK